jgi:small subunit ribosomal protein S4
MLLEQCKTCRGTGQKLFLKGDRCFSQKCALVRRAYAPGPQKKRRGGSQSDYKKTLVEKQTLKKWYGISERQFKKYVKQTLAKMGKVENVSDELIRRLEKRLDNAIFRLNFAKSRAQARQMVTHGFFMINGKRVNIPSYEVKKGDVISVKPSKKQKAILKESANLQKNQEPHA